MARGARGPYRGKAVVVRGRRYRSRFEAQVCGELDARGVEYVYEPYSLPYVQVKRYTPDLELPNGILVEIKGWFAPSDRRKFMDVRHQHPEKDIRLVLQKPFQRLRKVGRKDAGDGRTKARDLTVASWCRKNGIRWSHGSVPQDWLDESKKEIER